MAVKLWPTPAARDHKGANGEEHLANGTGRLHLDQLPNYVTHLWQTPAVADTTGTRAARGGARGDELLLRGQADALVKGLWSTPRASDGPKGGRDAARKEGGPSLPVQAFSLPAPPTSTDGDESSPSTRRLNPRFVEWLMGWPLGWTDFGCSATGFTRWRQEMRSALSALGSLPAAAPVQSSLFSAG